MTLDALAGTGLQRRAVVCPQCSRSWDERVVDADAPTVAGASDLCPSCLLQRQEGEDPYPD